MFVSSPLIRFPATLTVRKRTILPQGFVAVAFRKDRFTTPFYEAVFVKPRQDFSSIAVRCRAVDGPRTPRLRSSDAVRPVTILCGCPVLFCRILSPRAPPSLRLGRCAGGKNAAPLIRDGIPQRPVDRSDSWRLRSASRLLRRPSIRAGLPRGQSPLTAYARRRSAEASMRAHPSHTRSPSGKPGGIAAALTRSAHRSWPVLRQTLVSSKGSLTPGATSAAR
jgi:hypothetical protein